MKVSGAYGFILITATLPALGQFCPLRPLHFAEQDGYAAASLLFDDVGTGRPRLHVGGAFNRLGPVSSAGLVRWEEGQGWAAVPGAPEVRRMCVQVEAGREVLYAAAADSFWRYD